MTPSRIRAHRWSNGAMSLTDGDVAALARQAVDLLAPDIEIKIEPDADDDPYRYGPRSWLVWPLIDGRRMFGVWLQSTMTPAQALARLLDGLGEASESGRFWGTAFPACLPGHRHGARVREDSQEVVLVCPQTDEEAARISPAA